MDDYDLIWVLLEHGATVQCVARYLYNCRDHDGDRLTLRSADEMRSTLERILDKHGIAGPERQSLLADKSPWLGRSLEAVATEREWMAKLAREAGRRRWGRPS